MNSLPKTVTRQCRDLNLGLLPESSRLTTRLPSSYYSAIIVSTVGYEL